MAASCAIVTGASRGIGRAIALRLAESGHNIAFCYRSSVAAAHQVAKEISSTGVRCFHAPCDVANADAVQEFVDAAQAELGHADVVVNAAGIIRDNPMVLMQQVDWHAVISTNLTGTYHFCRAVVFGMMKRKSGVVVNISSIAGVYGNATQVNYSAAKAGINGMSRALAKELAPYGIRVNVVAPGFIETDMTAELAETKRRDALARIPLGRFGTVEDVAELTAFLVSNRATYITGQVMQVDGGLVL